MSLTPSIAASAGRNYLSDHESFHQFFECWLVEQNQYLHHLISASTQQNNNESLQSLVNQVLDHYEHYYQIKSRWAKLDVLAMFSPSWTTSLEHAFLWIGGWRPSMAFHLLYSKSGLQLEAQLHDLIRGLRRISDLGDLSPSQLIRVDEFQRRIIKEEKEITEKMAKHQETVADTSMVELSHVVSEIIMKGEETETEGSRSSNEKVESTLAPKEKGLQQILQNADDLRLNTIKGIINILTPIQAVHFLIAAAELHLRLHEWGKKRDVGKKSDVRTI